MIPRNRHLILASSSPRRQYLMREIGFTFTIEKPGIDEDFPATLPVHQVAKYLAAKKAEYFRPRMHEEIVVTADTVVILDQQILNKPQSRDEAIAMLSMLSGNTHRVMTGVCIFSKEREESFDETTYVTFHALAQRDIEYYIDRFKPFDKAGSYGAQDCLPPGMNPCSTDEIRFLERIKKSGLIEKTFTSPDAMTIIKEIRGSYFNVMGLPIHHVHEHLVNWQ